MAKPPKVEHVEMPFLDHLEELRWRIIWSLAAIAGGMVVGATIMFIKPLGDRVIHFLLASAIETVPDHQVHFTRPADGFSLRLNTAFVFAVALALPVILFQIWAFLAPGLYKTERRVTAAVIVSGVGLFVSGAALAFFVVVPLAVPWLLGWGTADVTAFMTVDGYFPLVLALVLGFGVCFQLPLILLALSALGVITAEFMSKYRRHSVLVIVVVSEIATPGDLIWSTLMLAIPLYIFYEISIIGARLIERRKRKKKEAEEAEAAEL